MSVLTQPTNPNNNTSRNVFTTDTYREPFALATEIAGQNGLPEEMLDKIHTDCADLVKDDWLAFIDMFQMNIAFETDYIEFVESQTPDTVIDDDGAITRSADVFTIVPANIEGWETGEDYFIYQVDDVIAVYDATKKEMGVITVIDKAGDNFTAVTRNGASWTVATTNLTIDVNGSDFDKASCGPEGRLELRKTKATILKMITIKDAMKTAGGKRYAFRLPTGEVRWYDDNTLMLDKRFNKKIAKTLLNDIASANSSAAHTAGKYGTQGLFDKLRTDGLVSTGYISDISHLQAVTAYWDSLGWGVKEFIAHVDRTQYRHFETIGSQLASRLNIELHVVLNNSSSNYARFGFNSLEIDGYTIHFSKWGMTDGNSPFGKNRVSAQQPKGIIMPVGTVSTMINGVEKQTPYIFKAYQDKAKYGKAGMVRTYFTGGFNGDGDCEYAKISKSTTVGLAVVCPEAITIID